MRVGRWAGGAALALALAVAPGIGRLSSPALPVAERAPLPIQRLQPTPPPAPPAEVAITPPDVLVGEPATPAAPSPTFRPSRVPADGEVFALLIGIDDYPGSAYDLRSAVADVDTIDAALAGFDVPAGNRVVLRDGQATRPAVVAAVRSLVRQGGPGATYVLAYAGHALHLDADTQAMLLADGEQLTDRALAELLAPATTQRMWLVFATCFAGGFTELVGPGRVLTGAAPADEQAWEDPALNASYLVHYLVREGWLLGKAGDSVQEAFTYADAALDRDHPDRRPVQLDEVGGRLLLGPGDPADGLDQAPDGPDRAPSGGASSEPAPSRPPASPPPEDDEPPCVLGVLYC
jgi:hypothetical protein